MPKNQRHFELIILGCSGGPLSGKTSSFLLKPTDVTLNSILEDNLGNDCLFAIDAGTGLTSIVDILNSSNTNGSKSSFLLDLYPRNPGGSNTIEEFTNCKNLAIEVPFKGANATASATNYQVANAILNSITGYLITHSHLDHVSSLVINSPAFAKTKLVYGLEKCIESIKNNLFNDLVWPDLVGMDIVSPKTLEKDRCHTGISKRYSITPFEVSHGTHSHDQSRYISTAFLINDLKHDYSILMFGDVESDLSSKANYNLWIWNSVKHLITGNRLNSIVIECSTVDKQPPLFGHLTPSNLIYELLILRKLCVDTNFPEIDEMQLSYEDSIYSNLECQPLNGLNLIITHVKETLDDTNPRQEILNKLNDLNLLHNLQIHFTIALSGVSLIL